MSTLLAMKARIANEIARDDLSDEIAQAITTAIEAYQGERFGFSDTLPGSPLTFNTVAGQWIYTAAANAAIGTLLKVDYAIALIGTWQQGLGLESPENIRIFNQSGDMRGQPMWYGYEGGALLLSPVPDKVYTITIDSFRKVAAPANDNETDNVWMTDGELLIRSRAKYELALNVTRNATMAQAMSPTPPGAGETGHAAYYAYRDLKKRGNRVTSMKRVRAMQF